MKKNLFILLLLLLSIHSEAQIRVLTPADITKGIACDKQRFRIAYDMSFIKDTLRSNKPVKESMILEIGSSVSLFYSYAAFHNDSIYADDIAKGLSQNAINEHLNNSGVGQISWKLYKNYPQKGFSSLLDGLGMERYCCVEKMQMPDWKVCSDSTMMILGYNCRKATAIYKGRTWCAWYAEDIPLGEGPWKLSGLPGLILRAYDSQRQYVFEASGMEQIKENTDLRYKGEKFEPIERKALDKLYARYYADPVGYITNNPNIKVTITDANGNPAAKPKAVPYNPIER